MCGAQAAQPTTAKCNIRQPIGGASQLTYKMPITPTSNHRRYGIRRIRCSPAPPLSCMEDAASQTAVQGHNTWYL